MLTLQNAPMRIINLIRGMVLEKVFLPKAEYVASTALPSVSSSSPSTSFFHSSPSTDCCSKDGSSASHSKWA